MENLYEILQVSKNASKEVIEKSYKTLAKKYHPDIAKNKEKAEEMMKKINNAYDILGDEEKRKKYDDDLENLQNLNNNNQQTTKSYYEQPRSNENANKNYYQNNNSYNRYNYQTNNMYDQYNYDNNYDYMNNPDLFNRLFKLDSTSRKILIIGLIAVFIFLVKLIFDIYNFITIGKNNNSVINTPINPTTSVSDYENIEEKFISNQELTNLFVNFMDDIKAFNIEKLNTYLAKEYKITDEELNNMDINTQIIKKIANNMTINITNPKSSNLNRGTIDIEVTRIDLDLVLLEVSKEIFLNYNQQYSQEKLNAMILRCMDANIDNTRTIKTTMNFIKEDEKWKIQFSNNDFYNVFGFNIKQQL